MCKNKKKEFLHDLIITDKKLSMRTTEWEVKILHGYISQMNKKTSKFLKEFDNSPEQRSNLRSIFEAVSDIQKKLREAQ